MARDRHERRSSAHPVAPLPGKKTLTSTEEVVMRAPTTDIVLQGNKNRLRPFVRH